MIARLTRPRCRDPCEKLARVSVLSYLFLDSNIEPLLLHHQLHMFRSALQNILFFESLQIHRCLSMDSRKTFSAISKYIGHMGVYCATSLDLSRCRHHILITGIELHTVCGALHPSFLTLAARGADLAISVGARALTVGVPIHYRYLFDGDEEALHFTSRCHVLHRP